MERSIASHDRTRDECPPEGKRVTPFTWLGESYVLVSVPVRRPSGPVKRLTPAERAVAALIARGLSNGEIASVRGASVRTVANQVAAALRKLGVHSRYQIVHLLDGGRVDG